MTVAHLLMGLPIIWICHHFDIAGSTAQLLTHENFDGITFKFQPHSLYLEFAMAR